MQLTLRSLLPLLLASTLTTTGLSAQGKNMLFYGNSYTYYSWGYGVPELVGLIAEAAGHPSPNIVQALIGGSNLQIHATDPAQVAAITTSLPAGQTWDHVIMQENSLGATPHFGFSPTVFRNSALTIMTNVRNHSPAASAVMYQTWARAWGHMYYPAPWTDPMDMHNMVRGNYDLAVADLNAAFGAGAATKAAVGDAVALLEWDPLWYHPDKSHPGPSMTMLAAMCIYTSIYNQPVCDVDPNFPNSALALALAPHNITESIWNLFAGLADRSAPPSNRRYPGSGDHLLMLSATGSDPLGACPVRHVTTGTQVQLQIMPVNGVYNSSIGTFFVDFMLTGSPPGPSITYPELQVNLAGAIYAPLQSLSNPYGLTFQMPFTLPGGSFLVQGVSLQGSTETGNTLFTTTDAHELIFF